MQALQLAAETEEELEKRTGSHAEAQSHVEALLNELDRSSAQIRNSLQAKDAAEQQCAMLEAELEAAKEQFRNQHPDSGSSVPGAIAAHAASLTPRTIALAREANPCKIAPYLSRHDLFGTRIVGAVRLGEAGGRDFASSRGRGAGVMLCERSISTDSIGGRWQKIWK